MGPWSRMLATIDREGAAALVGIVAAAGSVPREAGARMVVTPSGGFWGTVGGGALEWALIEAAERALAEVHATATDGRGVLRDWPLGPDLGQCCGGRVTTLTEVYGAGARNAVAALAFAEAAGGFDSTVSLGPQGQVRRTLLPTGERGASAVLPAGSYHERFADDRTSLLLFGAGHVGRALVLALAPLPFAVRWIDSRRDAFPAQVPANVTPVHAPDPADEIAPAAPGSLVLVMTHSHPLDLTLVDAALRRDDLGFVGLIGSRTKRTRFLSRLRAAGHAEEVLSRLVCPIGVPGLGGKDPAIIAASVAVQLLQAREALARAGEWGHRSSPNEAGRALRRAGGRP